MRREYLLLLHQMGSRASAARRHIRKYFTSPTLGDPQFGQGSSGNLQYAPGQQHLVTPRFLGVVAPSPWIREVQM